MEDTVSAGICLVECSDFRELPMSRKCFQHFPVIGSASSLLIFYPVGRELQLYKILRVQLPPFLTKSQPRLNENQLQKCLVNSILQSCMDIRPKNLSGLGHDVSRNCTYWLSCISCLTYSRLSRKKRSISFRSTRTFLASFLTREHSLVLLSTLCCNLAICWRVVSCRSSHCISS